MPRRPRHFLPGIPLHIIQRGNNRQVCFYTDRDYVVYLDKLHQYSLTLEVDVHSFVLMTNHVHLLLTPRTEQGASNLLQALGRYYVLYINSTYARTGTLWEGRFKASLINSLEYLLTVSRYIELNPVRANMVQDPAEYPWSSYRFNAMGKPIKLLKPHQIYLSLGNTEQERQKAYRSLFGNQFPELPLNEIRTATNKGWILGNNRFKKQIEQQLGYEIPPFKQGGDRKSAKYKGKPKFKLL